MVRYILLCLSTVLSFAKGCAEDNPGTRVWNTGHPTVDNQTCLFPSSSSANRHSLGSQSQLSHFDPSHADNSSSITQQIEATGIQIIRECLQSSGLPADVVSVLMSSWRDSTNKQYCVYVNKWVGFCCEQEADPCSSLVKYVLQF